MEATLPGRAGYAAAILAGSLVVHLAIIIAVANSKPSTYAAPHQVPLEVAVVSKPLEKPAPPPPPPPLPPQKLRPQPLRRLARRTPVAPPAEPRPAPPPPQNAPPPPSVEAKEISQTPPVVLPGITLESTTQGGTFAAPTGNTLYGEPPRKAVEPGTAKPYKAEKYVAAAQVTELPNIDFTPDLKSFYPREAQQRGFEADVVLRVLVDSDGSVAKVDVLSDPGQGLGAAGARAMRAFRFRPGKLGGTPVATTITFTLHFRIVE
ncbi:MAG: energy transducer TonB [Myxococcales bacterium]